MSDRAERRPLIWQCATLRRLDSQSSGSNDLIETDSTRKPRARIEDWLIGGVEVTRICGYAVQTARHVKFCGATGAMGVHERRIASTKNPITVPNNSDESLTKAGIEACPIKSRSLGETGVILRELGSAARTHNWLAMAARKRMAVAGSCPQCERIAASVF